MSKESDLFVQNLKASVTFMAEQTVELYKAKLSKWHLRREQWAAALDAIIEANLEGKVPPLPAIYAELKKQQSIASPEPDLGWAYFTLHGNQFAIRIHRNGGDWTISDLTTDDHGQVKHCQPHYGEPVIEHIPVEAEGFEIIAEKIYIPPDEIVDARQVKELIEAIDL